MSAPPTISVCIPTHDMGGQGGRFLAHSLARLAEQDCADFEVVVSDQSETPAVAEACAAFAGRLAIRRLDNRAAPRQASANCNHAMRHARGRILKILFQDDYLCDPRALGRIRAAFAESGRKWVLTGSAVTRDGHRLERPMVPRWHDQIRFGRNTISSPSVLALEAGHDLWFDENLVWLMDADMYDACYRVLGAPAIVPETLVANRLHGDQVSARISRQLRRRELRHVAAKGGLMRAPGDLGAFLYQYLKALG